jgi:hypothetical protein
MKTKQQLSKWCKSALMLSIVAAVLTFTSCQKDDLLVEGASGAGDYKLSLTTQYSHGSVLLKDPKTYVVDYVLTV